MKVFKRNVLPGKGSDLGSSVVDESCCVPTQARLGVANDLSVVLGGIAAEALQTLTDPRLHTQTLHSRAISTDFQVKEEITDLGTRQSIAQNHMPGTPQAIRTSSTDVDVEFGPERINPDTRLHQIAAERLGKCEERRIVELLFLVRTVTEDPRVIDTV